MDDTANEFTEMTHIDILMPLARHVDFAAACPGSPLTTWSRTQGAYHEHLRRLSLVWWRRAAEDPWRGSPLLFRYMPTPLARDLPQARGVRPEGLAIPCTVSRARTSSRHG
jgi:hypothetical protein